MTETQTRTVTGYPLPQTMSEAADYAEATGALVVVNVNEGDGLEFTPADVREYDEDRAPGEPLEFVRYLFPEEQQERKAEKERREEERRQEEEQITRRLAEREAARAGAQQKAEAQARAAIATAHELPEALAAFAITFSDLHTAGDVGPGMTCAEAEALAGVLRVLGRESAAERFLDLHAIGDDDPEDQHYDRHDGPEQSEKH